MATLVGPDHQQVREKNKATNILYKIIIIVLIIKLIIIIIIKIIMKIKIAFLK